MFATQTPTCRSLMGPSSSPPSFTTSAPAPTSPPMQTDSRGISPESTDKKRSRLTNHETRLACEDFSKISLKSESRSMEEVLSGQRQSDRKESANKVRYRMQSPVDRRNSNSFYKSALMRDSALKRQIFLGGQWLAEKSTNKQKLSHSSSFAGFTQKMEAETSPPSVTVVDSNTGMKRKVPLRGSHPFSK